MLTPLFVYDMRVARNLRQLEKCGVKQAFHNCVHDYQHPQNKQNHASHLEIIVWSTWGDTSSERVNKEKSVLGLMHQLERDAVPQVMITHSLKSLDNASRNTFVNFAC